MARDPLAHIPAITLPCTYCQATGHFGSKHTVKRDGSRVILRCRGCGSGYAIDPSSLPHGAPPELVIQAIGNLVSSRIADILPPDSRPLDEGAA